MNLYYLINNIISKSGLNYLQLAKPQVDSHPREMSLQKKSVEKLESARN